VNFQKLSDNPIQFMPGVVNLALGIHRNWCIMYILLVARGKMWL